MDRILVFDEGKVIEDGNHKALLQIDGHYARLWNMQAGGFLPEQQT
jgi:ATP-binding cassette subfamily B protein